MTLNQSKTLTVTILNLKGGNKYGFKKGIKKVPLNEIKYEMLNYLEKGLISKSWVIKKDDNITTTILYFDIDKMYSSLEQTYKFIVKCLNEIYEDDLLDCLIFKRKNDNKYHFYFVNIFN